MGEYCGMFVDQPKAGGEEIPTSMQEPTAALAAKIDIMAETYGITRDELFALVSEVLDGNINS